jgi:hypothetical protein
MKNIIGLIGLIGSGKGTVGDYIVEKYNFKSDSFAKPVKDAVSVIFGWDRNLLEGKTLESRQWREEIDEYWSNVVKFDISPRLALQLFGTECIRKVFHQNVWSASLIKRYEKSNSNVVITDCRFKNEIDAIRNAGGYVIRVKRGEEPDWYEEYLRLYENDDFYQIGKLEEEGYFPHVSESDWIGSEFDYIIDNSGTLDELYEKIDRLMIDINV